MPASTSTSTPIDLTEPTPGKRTRSPKCPPSSAPAKTAPRWLPSSRSGSSTPDGVPPSGARINPIDFEWSGKNCVPGATGAIRGPVPPSPRIWCGSLPRAGDVGENGLFCDIHDGYSSRPFNAASAVDRRFQFAEPSDDGFEGWRRSHEHPGSDHPLEVFLQDRQG